MPIDLEILKKMNKPEHFAITKHAKNRFVERNISIDDVTSCINSGIIVKQYEDDKPYPSCLIAGTSSTSRDMCLVVSMKDSWIYIITAYYKA